MQREIAAVRNLPTSAYHDRYDFSAYERAREHPLFGALRPIGQRLLTTRPHRRLSAELSKTLGGLLRPKQSNRVERSYGLVCTVLRPSRELADTYPPGMRVLVDQFAGTRVYDLTEGRECEMWMVAEGDVMARLEFVDDEACDVR